MSEKVEIRIHGGPSKATLIYLPGLHGDWTLVGSFRRALAGRARFIEVTYPRTLSWSLEDYSAEVTTALLEVGITHGWLLGESFGSQVVWPMLVGKELRVEGVILTGGFVRHPVRWAVRMAERVCGGVSLTLLTRILFGYAKLARFRHRHSPEMLIGLEEFIARRTELDRQAAKHRLCLVARSDPCSIAKQITVPLYAVTGFFDPIVPWFWPRRWLRKNCPGLREYRIIWRADHNVLGTAPQTAADQVIKWMTGHAGSKPAM
jgi:pimeloyl-ACP methyl ester carboxylesterase